MYKFPTEQITASGQQAAEQISQIATTAFNGVEKMTELNLATGKSVVFGILIALVGCHYGLGVKPNTESLGQGTTASVVTSITSVILVDALFAMLFQDVGL